MIRIKGLALAAAFAATISPAAAGTVGEPADGLIFDAISAPTTTSYTGHIEAVRIGNERSEVFLYRVEHRAPDLSVRFYTAPKSLDGDEVVTRGKTSYSIDAHRRRVVVSNNGATGDEIAFDDNYLLLRANYQAVKRSDDSLDGRDVYVVALINKYTHKTTLVTRIDRQTKLVLDTQKFGPDGSLASEVRFADVRFVPTIGAADFDVPKNFTRIAGPNFGAPTEQIARLVANAGFAAQGPKFLPEGFSPVEGKLVVIKGVRTLHLLYSDGIRTVSLFEDAKPSDLDMGSLRPETTTISGRPARYAETGQTTLLAWSNQGLHYVLVGELELDELQHIAASI